METNNFGISIDLDFNATTGKGEIFWMSPEGDLPFIGMDQTACSYTQCPITKDERKSYSQRFDTMRKYPAVSFFSFFFLCHFHSILTFIYREYSI